MLFQSFDIGGYILNNQKILISLDACSRSSFFNSLGGWSGGATVLG